MQQTPLNMFCFADPCFYKNLRFKGGDLDTLQDVDDFEACKSRCEDLKDCHFFSLSEEQGCQLKSKDVEIAKNKGYLSGASDAACRKFFHGFKMF